MVKFEFKWGFQGWFWGGWVGCWVAALPLLRVFVCTGIGLRQSRSDRQLVYASCPWVIDGRGLVLVPLSFLVLVVRPFCGWPGCSGVNLECIQCGCLWLGVDVGLSII